MSDIQGKCRHHKWTLQQYGAPAHTIQYNWLPEKRERRLHETWHVAPNSCDLNPIYNAVCGAFSNESITDENLTWWKNWRQR